MGELITQVPIRIIAGLCQTSNRRELEFGKHLTTMQVTNLNGNKISAINGIRLCTDKSRTSRDPKDSSRKGGGVDSAVLEDYRLKLIDASIHNTKPPEIPIIQGALWAQELQKYAEGVKIGFESIGWPQAIAMLRMIQPGTGNPWSASVDTLGAHIEDLAEIAGQFDATLGIKNPKYNSTQLPREDNAKLSAKENGWLGLGMYALCAHHLPKKIEMIERGVLVPNLGDWRGLTDDTSAEATLDAFEAKVNDSQLSEQIDISMAYDPSHSNGPDRVQHIVEDSIKRARVIRKNGLPLYSTLYIEVKENKGEEPLSDAKQHITGEQLQEVVDGIAKFRPIQGYK